MTSSHWFVLQPVRRFGCTLALFAIATCGLSSSARAQHNTQRGATLGGITGAIAGAIIGENNDEAGAGAAIGGAVGAVAGGVLGNARDKEIREQNYRHSPRYSIQQPTRTPTPVYTQTQPTGAVSYSDVIAMSRSGVGESVILNQIATRGVQRQPIVSDIISLHQQGVSETVIAAMQQAPVGNQLSSPAVVTPPSIVETPVYVAPRVYHDHHYHHRPVRRARPSYHHHYGH